MIELYYGAPRSGKTTYLAKLSRSALKHYDHVYSNFPLADCLRFDPADLGTYDLGHSLVIIDESAICYNNRNFKNFPKAAIDYLKLHGHYHTDFVFASQHYADTEVTIRRLAERQYNLRKVGPFTFIRHISQKIDIDETTHQLMDFDFKQSIFFGGISFFFRPFYYKYFDSWDCPPLPPAPCEPWNKESEGPNT